jgi:protein TonB
MPEFPGGNRGLSRFIQRNLRYPRVSAGNQKNGKVTVRFVVDENGNTREPHIVKGLGNPYDQEVVRMINSMPRWSPGEQNGKQVPVYKSLRISFNVDG